MSVVAKASIENLGKLENVVDVSSVKCLESDFQKDVVQVTLVLPDKQLTVVVSSLGCVVSSIVLCQAGEVLSLSHPSPCVVGRISGLCEDYQVDSRSRSHASPFKYDSNADSNEFVPYSNRVWTLINTFCSQKSARAVFELESDHMDQGHPGAVKIEAHLSAALDLNGKPRFECRYRARLAPGSPCSAFVNLSAQLHFALGGDAAMLWIPNAPSESPYCKPAKLAILDKEEIVLKTSGDESLIACEVSGKHKVKLTVRTTSPALRISTTPENDTVCVECAYPNNAPNLPDFSSRMGLFGGVQVVPSMPSPKKSTEVEEVPLFRRLMKTRRASLPGTSSPMPQASSYDYEYDEYSIYEFSVSLFA